MSAAVLSLVHEQASPSPDGSGFLCPTGMRGHGVVAVDRHGIPSCEGSCTPEFILYCLGLDPFVVLHPELCEGTPEHAWNLERASLAMRWIAETRPHPLALTGWGQGWLDRELRASFYMDDRHLRGRLIAVWYEVLIECATARYWLDRPGPAGSTPRNAPACGCESCIRMTEPNWWVDL